MPEKSYPIHYFKDGYHPVYAHNQKDEDRWMLEGWTNNYRNIPFQEFPKSVYRLDTGDTVIIEFRDPNGRIDEMKCKEREIELLANGYSLKPVAKQEVVEPDIDTKVRLRLNRLEVDVADMKENIQAILEAILPKTKQRN